MFKQTLFKGAAALGVGGLAVLGVAGAASANPKGSNVSFSASNDGASAGWSNGSGSAIDLTLGSSSGTFAVITLHRVDGAAVNGLTEPSFTTNSYAAGSPRYYITLSNGNSLWGYPTNSNVNGSNFGWAVNNGNTYQSWSSIETAEVSATVTGAYVIADGEQAPGTTDVITGLSFGGYTYN